MSLTKIQEPVVCEIRPWLLALGTERLPEEISLGNRAFRLGQVLKHDFFAITAVYEGTDGRVLLKMGRRAPIGILGLRWVGRLLAAREAAVLRRLQGIDGVPRLLDTWKDAGIVREFIEGRVLARGEPVPDDFFDQFRTTLDAIHRRGVACVDLEKAANVLASAEGRPCLFDFQISWYVPKRWGGESWLMRFIRNRLQKADRYHVLKMQRRIRPDQLPAGMHGASYRKPWDVWMHGVVFRPLTRLRRRVLRRLDPRRHIGERGWRSDDSTMEVT